MSKNLRIGLLSLALAMTSGVVLAQTAPPVGGGRGAKFEQHKQKMLAHIAARIQVLQTLQSCVQSATDRTAMKACHDAAKAARQAAKAP